MVWPILISVAVTPGAFSASAVPASAPSVSAAATPDRNFTVLILVSSWLLPLAQKFGTVAGAGHQHPEVVAGDDHAHAHGDVFRQQILHIDAAHARPFAVLAAGGDHRLVGARDLGVVELAGQAL